MADQSSSTTTPITPARFAAALKELSAENLALKVFELRNSIAHLDYSNAELRPYAEGLVPILGSSNAPTDTTTSTTAAAAASQGTHSGGGETPEASGGAGQGDQDCIDAIAENEVVIARMLERIDLIRAEVLERGLSWDELSGLPPQRDDPAVGVVPQGAALGASNAGADAGAGATAGLGAAAVTNGVNGVNGTSAATTTTNEEPHQAWRDGTFTTGTIRAGGPGLSDEELLRRLQEQIPGLGGGTEEDDRDSDGGMHL